MKDQPVRESKLKPPGAEEETEVPWEDAEQDALMEAYLSNLHTVREGELREASVVAVQDDRVLVNLDDKSEGVAPLSEFNGPDGEPHVKVGDRISVLVRERDSESGQIVVSYSDARRLVALKNLTESLEQNKTMRGKVVKAVKSGLLVDCGIECFMPASQIDIRRVERLEEWVGAEIDFEVIELNRRRQRAVISRRKKMEADRERVRAELMGSMKPGDIVEAEVRNVMDFGAFVDLRGVEAFIPREEVSWEKSSVPGEYLRTGTTIKARIVRLNAETGKITLSRRQTMEDPWLTVGLKYPKGSTVRGEVKGLTKFGAFVRLEEGLTGLIHVSDMSWSSAGTRPEEVLNEGDMVEVAVVECDSQRQRLSLGLKQLSEDPWTEVESKFPINSKLKGVVTGVTKFGAFVKLDDGIEGLIHQTDFTWDKKPKAPSEYVKVGDEVETMVIKTDKKARRISLGLRQLTPSPMDVFASQHKQGSKVQGKVISIIESGAFVEVAPDIEGFLPISQISEEKIDKVSQKLKLGDEITVKIVKSEPKANRLSLSMKAVIMEEERASMAGYLKDQDHSRGGMSLGEAMQKITLRGPNG